MYIRKFIPILGLVTVSLALLTMSSASGSVSPMIQQFTANMTGKEEVPPKDTKATGDAEFTKLLLSRISRDMDYRVNVTNMDKVTMVHIHLGKVGENGPPVVWLFNSTSNPTGPMNGMLSQGKITSNDFVGPLKGKPISDLVKLINNGQAYINVHTEPNPNGEIRGQIHVGSIIQ
jgi:hypothetical protein